MLLCSAASPLPDSAIPRHQPVAYVDGQPVAIDTGGDTLVEQSAYDRLTSGKMLRVLGRSARALHAPDGYLAHWYLTRAF
ncbi:MAG: hypothetical protein JOZ38_01310, partial [Candidatus Eremiobacteraeota bacterium]|nr:hypothetical protein [Candidatus Eremiobacteraeota bacterium]